MKFPNIKYIIIDIIVLIFIIILIVIIFDYKNRDKIKSYDKEIAIKIDSMLLSLKLNDSLYYLALKDKEEINKIRRKITTVSETNEIIRLKREFNNLKNNNVYDSNIYSRDTIDPFELYVYINNILKNQ